jgi:hypothetical protein
LAASLTVSHGVTGLGGPAFVTGVSGTIGRFSFSLYAAARRVLAVTGTQSVGTLMPRANLAAS